MKFRKSVLAGAVAVLAGGLNGNVFASGFALIEQSASGMGNAFAGGAASAEDASTIFFNPAGMSRLPGKQFVVAIHGIKPSAKFSDTGSVAAALQAQGGNGGDAGSLAAVPNAYFSYEVNPQTHVGLGLNSPFGLKTEYDSTWMGRFQAIKSKLETVNLNPSVSFQVNDNVTLGAGLNYQHVSGELTSAVNYAAAVYSGAMGSLGASAAAAGAAATAAVMAGEDEGLSTVKGTDSAWGYNLGALFNVSPETRVGLAYRSSIKYTLSGTVSFSANRPSAATLASLGPGAPLLAGGIAASTADGDVSLDIKLPATLSASVFHKVDDKMDVMADATWTQWSTFEQLQVIRSDGTTLQTVPEKWKDTWRVALGGNYHYNEQWTSRIGVAIDQTPVSDMYRTARIPDANRTWLAIGGQYKPDSASAVDVGYAHLFVSDASINQNQAAAGAGALIGNYKNSVDILSVQYSHSM